MSPYDPQRSRHRPSPAEADEPAPVDALLEPHPAESGLPEGVELDVGEDGSAVLHTAAADVELTADGDDVVVSTDDASVEIRADLDEVVISTGDEEILVDTSPHDPADELYVTDAEGARRSRLVAALVAAAITIALMVLWGRRRR